MNIRPLAEFPAALRRAISFVLLDIDDTVTTDGRLTAAAYSALENLSAAGLRVIPVTGRPAGWCDLIARFWPVDAVIGENGAFYFRYDHDVRMMTRRFWQSDDERESARRRLAELGQTIVGAVPGARIAADQPYRVADLAIDYAEDTGPLAPEDVDRIVALMQAAGAAAKVSSIHVNGWFGDWDKLGMTRRLFAEQYGLDLDRNTVREQVAFIGDSPNDEPMFARFPNSVAVANIRPYLPRLASPPAYIAEAAAGA
ncbi:MAG: HAD-IIB family hydrolase, partial [Alphaproteobacteria bacterium]|nr:HAD-IIB family hydrolase [Alphaproteobacteria bacterium]